MMKRGIFLITCFFNAIVLYYISPSEMLYHISHLVLHQFIRGVVTHQSSCITLVHSKVLYHISDIVLSQSIGGVETHQTSCITLVYQRCCITLVFITLVHSEVLYHSSNINEVIRSVLNFFLIFFFDDKISQVHKSTKKHQKALKSTRKH